MNLTVRQRSKITSF